MRVITSKSKNAESFYISKGYINDKGVSTSVIVRKLGTLKELLPEHGPTREDVLAWAKEEARLETLKYKQQQEEKQIKITFHADRQLDYDKQTFFPVNTAHISPCKGHKTVFRQFHICFIYLFLEFF